MLDLRQTFINLTFSKTIPTSCFHLATQDVAKRPYNVESQWIKMWYYLTREAGVIYIQGKVRKDFDQLKTKF